MLPFTHFIIIWSKATISKITGTMKSSKFATVMKLLFTLVLIVLIGTYYIKSYEIPTRSLDIEMFDTQHDSIIISNFTYNYSYVTGKNNSTYINYLIKDHPSPLAYTISRDSLIKMIDRATPQDPYQAFKAGLVKLGVEYAYELSNSSKDSLGTLLEHKIPEIKEKKALAVQTVLDFCSLMDTTGLFTPKNLISIVGDSVKISPALKDKFGQSLSILEKFTSSELTKEVVNTEDIVFIKFTRSMPRSFQSVKKTTKKSVSLGDPHFYDSKYILWQASEFSSKGDTAYMYAGSLWPRKEMITTAKKDDIKCISQWSSKFKPITRAEDCSQSNFTIKFYKTPTSLRIDTLRLNLDSPIIPSQMYPSPAIVGPDYLIFEGSDTIDKIIENGLTFYAQNPEMENKMLIKMFLLTGVLTALVGLVIKKYVRELFSNKISSLTKKHKKISIAIVIILFICLLDYTIMHCSAWL